jgi:hypothetical protein
MTLASMRPADIMIAIPAPSEFDDQPHRHRLEPAWEGTKIQSTFSFSLEIPVPPETMDYKIVPGLSWHF